MVYYLNNPPLKLASHPIEAKDIFEDLITNCLRCLFLVIQDMFLKELSFSVHMRAIENPVPVDLLIIECSCLLYSHV